ncbi:phage tail protein [Sphingomonas sp. CJ20]
MFGSPYYPPPAFSFTVAVAGVGAALQLASGADTGFQEASGLDAKIETEAVREGGVNDYSYALPVKTSSPNLVLKRGYVTRPSFLSEWAAQTVGSTFSDPILTQTLVVLLLGSDRVPLVAWNCYRAWPVRWVTGPFDSQKNAVLSEVLEFAHSGITRIPLTEAVTMIPAVSALIG